MGFSTLSDKITDKKQLLNILRPGDVILTNERSTDWFIWVIKLSNFYKVGYKDRGWEHSVLYLGQDTIVEANPDGITVSSLTKTYLEEPYCEFLILRHQFANAESIQYWLNYCSNLQGSEYDFMAFIYFLFYSVFPISLHFLLGKDSEDSCFNKKDAYFCAELIATGMKYANIYNFERAPSKVRPIDFFNELLFKVVARYEEPCKDNKIIHAIKKFFLFIMYFIGSLLTPILFFIPFICLQMLAKNKNEIKS